MHFLIYSASEWDQRYVGLLFLDKQITYWACPSHCHTGTLFHIPASGKKIKVERRKQIGKGRKKEKKDKGVVKTGGETYSQS